LLELTNGSLLDFALEISGPSEQPARQTQRLPGPGIEGKVVDLLEDKICGRGDGESRIDWIDDRSACEEVGDDVFGGILRRVSVGIRVKLSEN
jgi:hypothetical protein